MGFVDFWDDLTKLPNDSTKLSLPTEAQNFSSATDNDFKLDQ